VQLPRLWGLGWDAARGRLLLGSVDGDGGVAVDAYDDQGSVLGAGERWQLSGGLFLADLTYDPDRDRFWGVDVGAGNCLTALDPVSLRRTGARICPPLDNSQRGLTYNPNDHTFYSGAWMDGIIQHFDGRGQMLDSSAVGLNIAGLAYAPASRRLYVSANAAVGYDVYILAPDDGYRILGGFDVPGMEAYQQAGLTLDCAGRLWLANQGTGEVIALASGEAATCAAADIPWLEVTPWQGTLAAGETVTLTLRFDAGLAGIGTHLAHAAIRNDGPYGLALLPLALDVQPRRTFFPYFPATTTLKPLPTATPPRP
jgi:hypothetical protein